MKKAIITVLYKMCTFSFHHTRESGHFFSRGAILIFFPRGVKYLDNNFEMFVEISKVQKSFALLNQN